MKEKWVLSRLDSCASYSCSNAKEVKIEGGFPSAMHPVKGNGKKDEIRIPKTWLCTRSFLFIAQEIPINNILSHQSTLRY